MPVSQRQLEIEFPKRWGGPQPGSGRPKGPRPRVLHRERDSIRNQPVHVTFRVRKEVPKLRVRRFFNYFRQSLARCSTRKGFRVIHYSIQNDHAHVIIEAEDKKKPLSDQKIADQLKAEGLSIARRTVTKYREGLGIESTKRRRVY